VSIVYKAHWWFLCTNCRNVKYLRIVHTVHLFIHAFLMIFCTVDRL